MKVTFIDRTKTKKKNRKQKKTTKQQQQQWQKTTLQNDFLRYSFMYSFIG